MSGSVLCRLPPQRSTPRYAGQFSRRSHPRACAGATFCSHGKGALSLSRNYLEALLPALFFWVGAIFLPPLAIQSKNSRLHIFWPRRFWIGTFLPFFCF